VIHVDPLGIHAGAWELQPTGELNEVASLELEYTACIFLLRHVVTIEVVGILEPGQSDGIVVEGNSGYFCFSSLVKRTDVVSDQASPKSVTSGEKAITCTSWRRNWVRKSLLPPVRSFNDVISRHLPVAQFGARGHVNDAPLACSEIE